MRNVLIAVLLATLGGCTYTKNMQVATARCASISGVSAILDVLPDQATYTLSKTATVACATTLKEILETQSFQSVPTSQLAGLLTTGLSNNGYGSYTPYVQTLLSLLGQQTANIDNTVTDFNKYLLIQSLDDIIDECTIHKWEWTQKGGASE